MRFLAFVVIGSLAAAGLLSPRPALAADCAAATNETETLICNDPALLALDNEMEAAYRTAETRLAERSLSMLEASQQRWITARNDRCNFGATPERLECLREMTAERRQLLSARAPAGAGGPAMIGRFEERAGDKRRYDISIGAVAIANEAAKPKSTSDTPAEETQLPGDTAFNNAIDALIAKAPFAVTSEFNATGDLYYSLTVLPTFAGENLLSALATIDRYDGGAHGNREFIAINIDRRSGPLDFAGVFGVENLPAVADACIKQLENDRRARFGGAIEEARLDEDVRAEIAKLIGEFSAWTFHSDSAQIDFAPYIVGSYAEGAYQCRIDYSLLRPLMRDPALLGR